MISELDSVVVAITDEGLRSDIADELTDKGALVYSAGNYTQAGRFLRTQNPNALYIDFEMQGSAALIEFAQKHGIKVEQRSFRPMPCKYLVDGNYF